MAKHPAAGGITQHQRLSSILKNPGTGNAYQGTIHMSAGSGNEDSFRFTGTRFRLGYQRGKNFGTVTVIIDDQPYRFREQAFDLCGVPLHCLPAIILCGSSIKAENPLMWII